MKSSHMNLLNFDSNCRFVQITWTKIAVYYNIICFIQVDLMLLKYIFKNNRYLVKHSIFVSKAYIITRGRIGSRVNASTTSPMMGRGPSILVYPSTATCLLTHTTHVCTCPPPSHTAVFRSHLFHYASLFLIYKTAFANNITNFVLLLEGNHIITSSKFVKSAIFFLN